MSDNQGSIHDNKGENLAAIFLAFSFIIALGASGILSYRWIRYEWLGKAEKLEFLWEQDLKKLAQENKLPPFWSEIKSYEVFGGTELAKDWAKKITPPIKLNPKGKYQLEILLLSFKEEDRLGAVIQYDAVEIESKNLVWEIGRTFLLKGKPDPLLTEKSDTAPEKTATESIKTDTHPVVEEEK